MPTVKVTPEEWRAAKSGLYNANSALQRLRTEVDGLSLTINRLERQSIEVANRLNELLGVLEEKGLI